MESRIRPQPLEKSQKINKCRAMFILDSRVISIHYFSMQRGIGGFYIWVWESVVKYLQLNFLKAGLSETFIVELCFDQLKVDQFWCTFDWVFSAELLFKKQIKRQVYKKCHLYSERLLKHIFQLLTKTPKPQFRHFYPQDTIEGNIALLSQQYMLK